jgi:hypothetical protein
MAYRAYHPRGELIHGYTAKKHPLHNTWVLLKQRCENVNCKAYKHYGGRGITICERWLTFKLFALDMGLKPSNEYSLDRIDNNREYSPENCRWATVVEQRLNRGVFKNSTSGVTGVQPTASGKFTSMIHINGKRFYLGTFNSIDEAFNARQDFVAKQAA